ncbi:MAG: tRNA (adenosine(37)-N6)-threonylcarbamoyltransferase complex dimerization subunit type 1 TsaB [Bifidobacteriaceae bacterium]|nr:tRNA (adenosine(37)-N6)-threonylcarbamoyltransferase complex dimerization subunit type 1 TsaB [Bifidobacteriaceae bacterium]
MNNNKVMLEIIIDSSFFYTVGIVQTVRQKDVKKGSYKSKIKVLGARQSKTAFEHVENLIPDIYNILKKANLSIRDIQAVKVGVGPAPFTGLRSGIAAGLGLAIGLGCKISGFNSLLVYALVSGKREVIVVNYARRGQVYWGHFIKEEKSKKDKVDYKTSYRNFDYKNIDCKNTDYKQINYKQLGLDISSLNEIEPILKRQSIVQVGNINLNKCQNEKFAKNFLKMCAQAPEIPLKPLYLRPPDIS